MSGARRHAVQVAAVGVAAPGRVDLGQVLVVAPVPGVDQRQQPGPVGARLGAEDPGGGPPPVAVLGQVGVARGRARSSARPARPAPATSLTASSSIATTCGKASRKKPLIRTVTSMRGRPSSASGDRLETGHPPRGVVPHRPDAEQCEHLGDVVARRPHRRGAPHRQPDRRAGTSPVSAQVALDQRLGHRLPGLPGQPGRDRPRVDRVEVAAGRQHVDQPAQRRARRARPARTAVERVQACVQLVGGALQPGHHLVGGEPQHARPPAVVGSRPSTLGDHGGRRPDAVQPRPPCRATSAAAGRLDRVGRRAPGEPSSSSPERLAQPGQRRPSRPRSAGRAAWPAPGRPGPRRPAAAPSTCSPSRIWASLISHSQPSTCSTSSSKWSSSRPLVQPEVVVELGGLDQRPDLRADRRAASPGPSPRCWRARRAAAPAGRCRRRSRPAPSAAPGGRPAWRAPGAWPASPRPGR